MSSLADSFSGTDNFREALYDCEHPRYILDLIVTVNVESVKIVTLRPALGIFE